MKPLVLLRVDGHPAQSRLKMLCVVACSTEVSECMLCFLPVCFRRLVQSPCHFLGRIGNV